MIGALFSSDGCFNQYVSQITALNSHYCNKSLEAVVFGLVYSIHLLTPSLHCTHEMQPLYKAYFKTLKSAWNVRVNSWMIFHREKYKLSLTLLQCFGKHVSILRPPPHSKRAFEALLLLACGHWMILFIKVAF